MNFAALSIVTIEKATPAPVTISGIDMPDRPCNIKHSVLESFLAISNDQTTT